jgi:hypothetical protein
LLESERERKHRLMMEDGMASVRTLVGQMDTLTKQIRRMHDVPDQIAELQTHVKVLFESAEGQRRQLAKDAKSSRPDWTKIRETRSPVQLPKTLAVPTETPGSSNVSGGSEVSEVSSANVTMPETTDESTGVEDRDADGSEDNEWTAPVVPIDPEVPEEGEITGDQDAPMATD